MKASKTKIKLYKYEDTWIVGIETALNCATVNFCLDPRLSRAEVMRRAKKVKAALVEVGAEL